MKKNDKRRFVIGTFRNFLNWMLAKHPGYKNVTCQNGLNCGCCSCCDTINFMVSFYDKDHKCISANWSANADVVYESANSGTINNAAEAADIMINHYMWGSADEFLHKVRYVRVGLRDEIENVETGWFMNREHGWEVEIFTGFVKPYHSSWMSGPPEVQEEWESGCF
jgi:hypothetical protein